MKQVTDNGSVGFVAHSQKTDNDTRGSSAFEDDADIVWRVKRAEDNETVEVSLAKRKDGPDGLVRQLLPTPVEDSLVLDAMSPFEDPASRPPEHAWDVLRLLTTDVFKDGAAASPLAETLKLKGSGSIYRCLNYLKSEQFVSQDRLGMISRFKITLQGASQLRKLDESL